MFESALRAAQHRNVALNTRRSKVHECLAIDRICKVALRKPSNNTETAPGDVLFRQNSTCISMGGCALSEFKRTLIYGAGDGCEY